ncbi:MAG: phosphonoacetaldehyde hydrolase [Candidatus Hydrogenedentes bacterium]|nr:phosphonoacetaldehyde hydrolase [Candidatus Hydrogenedentota bacterium]
MRNENKIVYKEGLKGVICDWAGTAVDFGSLSPVSAFEEAFKDFGHEVTRDEIRQFMGMYKKDHIRELLKLTRERFRKNFGRYPTEEDVEFIYGKFEPALIKIIREYSKPIKGVVEFSKEIRKMGLKIGSTTGYSEEVMRIVVEEASANGYSPDFWSMPREDVPGRPYPFMIYENAIALRIYPMSAIVKIGDTVSDIQEAHNAGCWSIGVVVSGNELGLSEEEIEEIDPALLKTRVEKGYNTLKEAGAHYVVDGIWDALPVIEEIDQRIRSGEQP